MYTSFHTAASIIIQKAFPGILGILLALPTHFVIDNLDEANIYPSKRDAITIEFYLNLDSLNSINNIGDERKRNDYLLSVLMGNLPDLFYQTTGLWAHYDTMYKIPISPELGLILNVGGVLVAKQILKGENNMLNDLKDNEVEFNGEIYKTLDENISGLFQTDDNEYRVQIGDKKDKKSFVAEIHQDDDELSVGIKRTSEGFPYIQMQDTPNRAQRRSLGTKLRCKRGVSAKQQQKIWDSVN